MIQENEELLLKDLCARLPYDVKIHAKYFDPDTNTEVEQVGVLSMIDTDTVVAFTTDNTGCYIYVTIHEVKPYLFPMSNMTEEQRCEYHNYCDVGLTEWGNELYYDCAESFDWLNAHHFDYRELIEKGLAIDATNLNIY